MVHTGLFATAAQIGVKVGENVDATGYVEANINAICLEVESYINLVTRYNWSDKFTAPATTTLNVDVWHTLGELESNLVAIYFISYNMVGYTSRIEAEDMVNILVWKSNLLIALLSDQKVKEFIINA